MASSSSVSSLPSSAWRSLPLKPGIYIYKNTTGQIIYVGKAKSLRDRVRSYFQPPQRLGLKTAALVSQISSLEYIEVGSEVEALLLESRLIKKHQPQYNIAAKDDKSPYYIHLTTEKFPRPLIDHEPAGALAGPFLSGQTARLILKHFRRIAPFCTANRPVKRPCLYSHLGLCQPCPGSAAQSDSQLQVAYRQNITRLRRLLSGKFSTVYAQLKAEMAAASKSQAYERAHQLLHQLKALDYLLHQPVSPEEYVVNPNLIEDQRQHILLALQTALSPHLSLPAPPARIEMYDIANLQGTFATGAMTVALNGEPDSRLYRHFTIRSKSTPDDVGMLTEMLTRRLARTDWPRPDLIVLDGGKSQLSLIDSLSGPLPPIIGLAKREETLIIPTPSSSKTTSYTELKLPLDHPGLRLLLRLRDEAHRFSRRLHHKHRRDLLK